MLYRTHTPVKYEMRKTHRVVGFQCALHSKLETAHVTMQRAQTHNVNSHLEYEPLDCERDHVEALEQPHIAYKQ